MGSSTSVSASQTKQANYNNAGEAGATYINLSDIALSGDNNYKAIQSYAGGSGGAGKSGGAAGVSGGSLQLNLSDSGTVKESFGLAQMALTNAFMLANSSRTEDSVRVDTAMKAVQESSDAGAQKKMQIMYMAAAGLGALVFIVSIIGGKK